MAAPPENIDAALNLLERAERPPLVLKGKGKGKGMAWPRAEDEMHAFIERTQIPFLRSPTGQGRDAGSGPWEAEPGRCIRYLAREGQID